MCVSYFVCVVFAISFFVMRAAILLSSRHTFSLYRIVFVLAVFLSPYRVVFCLFVFATNVLVFMFVLRITRIVLSSLLYRFVSRLLLIRAFSQNKSHYLMKENNKIYTRHKKKERHATRNEIRDEEQNETRDEKKQ